MPGGCVTRRRAKGAAGVGRRHEVLEERAHGPGAGPVPGAVHDDAVPGGASRRAAPVSPLRPSRGSVRRLGGRSRCRARCRPWRPRSIDPNHLRTNIGTVGRVPEPVKTRTYRSPRREEQAAATRQAVLRRRSGPVHAAGYAATTVADIARDAGVSVDTVYASVGRKPELLLAVHDMALAGGDAPVAAADRDYVAAMRQAPTAAAKLDVYARALAARLPQVVPLGEAMQRAAEDDAACRAVWEGLQARRLANMRRLAEELRAHRRPARRPHRRRRRPPPVDDEQPGVLPPGHGGRPDTRRLRSPRPRHLAANPAGRRVGR